MMMALMMMGKRGDRGHHDLQARNSYGNSFFQCMSPERGRVSGCNFGVATLHPACYANKSGAATIHATHHGLPQEWPRGKAGKRSQITTRLDFIDAGQFPARQGDRHIPGFPIRRAAPVRELGPVGPTRAFGAATGHQRKFLPTNEQAGRLANRLIAATARIATTPTGVAPQQAVNLALPSRHVRICGSTQLSLSRGEKGAKQFGPCGSKFPRNARTSSRICQVAASHV